MLFIVLLFRPLLGGSTIIQSILSSILLILDESPNMYKLFCLLISLFLMASVIASGTISIPYNLSLFSAIPSVPTPQYKSTTVLYLSLLIKSKTLDNIFKFIWKKELILTLNKYLPTFSI